MGALSNSKTGHYNSIDQQLGLLKTTSFTMRLNCKQYGHYKTKISM